MAQWILISIWLLGGLGAFAATLEVGPGKRFARPCAAFAVAANGDDIEIDAEGNYAGDVCNIARNSLYIRGVNGRPVIDGKGTTAGGKGIWTIQGNDIIVDNIEFLNARSTDRNGAGIRHEGRNIRIRRCYFHDNQNGILATSNSQSEILIEFSEFENNGSPEGQAHNLYVTSSARLIFRFNYSHRSIAGHLLKSRAAENYILYNRLLQEDGTGSYECDLPDQGKVWLIGNLIQQGRSSQNPNLITYGSESRGRYPDSHLYAFFNTIVNESSGPTERFLVAPGAQEFPIVFGSNIIYGRGEFSASAAPVLLQNLITQDNSHFVDPSKFDYHLREGSTAIGAASSEYPAGISDSARAVFESVAPACGKPRRDDGAPDMGAFEWDPQASDPENPCDASRIPEAGVRIQLHSSSVLVGGVSGSGRVILEQQAPASGMTVSLQSSAPEELILPQTIMVPEGAIAASFSFTTKPTGARAPVIITASLESGIDTTVEVTLSPVGVESLRLEPASVGGGSGSALGRVTINAPAPTGGVTLRVASSNVEVAQVPDQASVTQGATQGTFPIRTSPVAEETNVEITTSSATGEHKATLTVLPVGLLSIVPASVRFGGGSTVSVRINFNGPTPLEAGAVEFETSHPAIIPVPPPLPVGSGVTFTSLTVRTLGVRTGTTVTFTAIYRGSRKSVTLTVDPPELSSIGANLATFGSGGTIRITVTLNAPVSSAEAVPVSLSSDQPTLLRLPGSVSISPGAASVAFDAQTELVNTRTRVTVSGTTGGVSRTLTLNFDPLQLSTFTCPASARGGTTLTCRPTINGPAPVGGASVELVASAPLTVGVPANVVIATGQTTVAVSAQTRSVPLSSAVSITATYRGMSRIANVTLTP